MSISANILLIEDSPTSAMATKAMLSHIHNIDVNLTISMTLAEGLTQIHDNLDVILLDLTLPNGRGVEVLRKVLRRSTPFGIPVIVLSGDESPSTVFACAKVGADEYIPKANASPEILAATISLLLKIKRFELRMQRSEITLEAADSLKKLTELPNTIGSSFVARDSFIDTRIPITDGVMTGRTK